MNLMFNFDSSLESIINLSPELADWVERNQSKMSYFELTHSGCSNIDFGYASPDVRVLSKMADSVFSFLESDMLPEEKVENAKMAISEIYDQEKENLSKVAKKNYCIKAVEKPKVKVKK